MSAVPRLRNFETKEHWSWVGGSCWRSLLNGRQDRQTDRRVTGLELLNISLFLLGVGWLDLLILTFRAEEGKHPPWGDKWRPQRILEHLGLRNTDHLQLPRVEALLWSLGLESCTCVLEWHSIAVKGRDFEFWVERLTSTASRLYGHKQES